MSHAQTDIRATRPEAIPADPESLLKSQREGYDNIVAMLSHALAELKRRQPDAAQDNEVELNWMDRYRSSHVAYISGQRGSGKTTVYLSLFRKLNEAVSDSYEKAAGLKDLGRHVILLEPLDMETLPEASHLVPAILARIERAVEQKSGVHATWPGLLAAEDDTEPAVRIQQYQARVIRALDGNLKERRSHLDTEAYAAEVRRHEEDRLSLSKRLNQLLAVVSQNLRRISRGNQRMPETCLFVLPVDDVDLKPSRALEVLRLIRTFSAPQLFLIVLGQIEVTDLVLQMHTANEFATVYKGNPSLLSVTEDEFKRRVSEVAAANLRKLIPPQQVLHLALPTLDEALSFTPFRDLSAGGPEPPNLSVLLAQIKVPWDDSVSQESLLDFVTFSTGEGEDLQLQYSRFGRSPAYHGLEAFKLSPRRLVDLWSKLSEELATNIVGEHTPSAHPLHVDAKSSDDEAKRIEIGGRFTLLFDHVLTPFWHESVKEDAQIAFDSRRRILNAEASAFKISAPVRQLQYYSYDMDIERVEDLNAPVRRRLLFNPITADERNVRRHQISLGPETAPIPLTGQTAAAFVLWHDLDVYEGGLPQARPRDDLYPLSSASVVWSTHLSSKPVKIDLLPPLTSTFKWATAFDLDMDRFLHALVRSLPDNPRDGVCDELFYHWIACGNRLLLSSYDERRKGLSTSVTLPSAPNWNEVFVQLDLIASFMFNTEEKDFYRERDREWLIRVTMMLMPESYFRFPWETYLHASLKSLISFLEQHSGVIIARREHRFREDGFNECLPELGRILRGMARLPHKLNLNPRATTEALPQRTVENIAAQIREELSQTAAAGNNAPFGRRVVNPLSLGARGDSRGIAVAGTLPGGSGFSSLIPSGSARRMAELFSGRAYPPADSLLRRLDDIRSVVLGGLPSNERFNPITIRMNPQCTSYPWESLAALASENPMNPRNVQPFSVVTRLINKDVDPRKKSPLVLGIPAITFLNEPEQGPYSSIPEELKKLAERKFGQANLVQTTGHLAEAGRTLTAADAVHLWRNSLEPDDIYRILHSVNLRSQHGAPWLVFLSIWPKSIEDLGHESVAEAEYELASSLFARGVANVIVSTLLPLSSTSISRTEYIFGRLLGYDVPDFPRMEWVDMQEFPSLATVMADMRQLWAREYGNEGLLMGMHMHHYCQRDVQFTGVAEDATPRRSTPRKRKTTKPPLRKRKA